MVSQEGKTAKQAKFETLIYQAGMPFAHGQSINKGDGNYMDITNYNDAMKRASELLQSVSCSYGINVADIGTIECCTTGDLLYRSKMTSPKFMYTVKSERIANDPYWDKYNDTDKFEVIKV